MNLRNLSGFTTASLANDNRSGVSFNQIQNRGAVFIHGKPLPLLFHASIAESRRGRGRGSGGQEQNSAFFVVDYARLLGAGLPEMRHCRFLCFLCFLATTPSFRFLLTGCCCYSLFEFCSERVRFGKGKGARAGYGPSLNWSGSQNNSWPGFISINPRIKVLG